jgi:hypothetical protein
MIRAKEVIERSRMNYGKTAIDVRVSRSHNTPARRESPPQNGAAVAAVQEVPKEDESIVDPSKVY